MWRWPRPLAPAHPWPQNIHTYKRVCVHTQVHNCTRSSKWKQSGTCHVNPHSVYHEHVLYLYEGTQEWVGSKHTKLGPRTSLALCLYMVYHIHTTSMKSPGLQPVQNISGCWQIRSRFKGLLAWPSLIGFFVLFHSERRLKHFVMALCW